MGGCDYAFRQVVALDNGYENAAVRLEEAEAKENAKRERQEHTSPDREDAEVKSPVITAFPPRQPPQTEPEHYSQPPSRSLELLSRLSARQYGFIGAGIVVAVAVIIMVASSGPGGGSSAPAPAADDAAPPPAVKADTPPSSNPIAKADTAPKAAPTAAPEFMKAPAVVAKPEGTLNVGLREMGPFFVHPQVMTYPQILVQGTAPIGEGLLHMDLDRNFMGLLAESWSISDDFLTWTFNLNKGVQFHKGYGEMTSQDVAWSMQQYRTSKHSRAGMLENFWQDRQGSETPDPYTVVVNTGEPVVDLIAMEWHMTTGFGSTFIVSKKQSDEIGVDAASQDIAATGPWEIVEHRTGEFWKMAAVEDH